MSRRVCLAGEWRQKGEEPDLSSRYRAIAALLVVPLIIFAFFTYGSAIATRAYMEEASAQAGTALRLAVSALSGHLNRYEALPALIADHDDIKEVVKEAPTKQKRRKDAA